jgi:hypothetical protein
MRLLLRFERKGGALLSHLFEENTMNFLSQLLRGISFIPALVNGIEGLFACKSGAEKKNAAISFLESALATVDAVAAREIVDPEKFRDGISKIIDGTVECLNASTWAKENLQSASVSPQR